MNCKSFLKVPKNYTSFDGAFLYYNRRKQATYVTYVNIKFIQICFETPDRYFFDILATAKNMFFFVCLLFSVIFQPNLPVCIYSVVILNVGRFMLLRWTCNLCKVDPAFHSLTPKVWHTIKNLDFMETWSRKVKQTTTMLHKNKNTSGIQHIKGNNWGSLFSNTQHK